MSGWLEVAGAQHGDSTSQTIERCVQACMLPEKRCDNGATLAVRCELECGDARRWLVSGLMSFEQDAQQRLSQVMLHKQAVWVQCRNLDGAITISRRIRKKASVTRVKQPAEENQSSFRLKLAGIHMAVNCHVCEGQQVNATKKAGATSKGHLWCLPQACSPGAASCGWQLLKFAIRSAC